MLKIDLPLEHPVLTLLRAYSKVVIISLKVVGIDFKLQPCALQDSPEQSSGSFRMKTWHILSTLQAFYHYSIPLARDISKA